MARKQKPPPTPPDGEAPKPVSFEAGLDELEGIVKQLETAELPLEQALELFEKGVSLSESCRTELEQAESKVEILLKRGRRLEAEPFELDGDDQDGGGDDE